MSEACIPCSFSPMSVSRALIEAVTGDAMLLERTADGLDDVSMYASCSDGLKPMCEMSTSAFRSESASSVECQSNREEA